MDDCLSQRIASDLPVTLVSSLLSPSSVCRSSTRNRLVFIHTLASVASSLQEARPFPGSGYLTPPGKFWPPHSSSKFCNTGGGNALIYFWLWGPTVCSAISNHLWTFKLNCFPQTEHIIPHMNKLLRLETVRFTIYQSNMYFKLTLCYTQKD